MGEVRGMLENNELSSLSFPLPAKNGYLYDDDDDDVVVVDDDAEQEEEEDHEGDCALVM